jgi:hypothetical protein
MAEDGGVHSRVDNLKGKEYRHWLKKLERINIRFILLYLIFKDGGAGYLGAYIFNPIAIFSSSYEAAHYRMTP